MKFKPSGVSTVIIVDKTKGASKTLQVKTKHISRLKHYVASVFGLIVILSGTIFYLNSQNKQQEIEKAQLQAQITKLKNAIPPPAPAVKTPSVSKAQTYIQEIEGKLQTINSYLKKRGLRGFSTKAVGGNGGEEEASKLTDEEKYSLYDDYLSRFLTAVAFTPMGYPRISSLTSYFGYRSDPFDGGHAEFHPGIDFKGERGDAAKCTANGRVVFAGWFGGYGNCVRIQHKNNFETLYGHLSKIVVKVGQEVTAGEKIGEIGSTGRSTGNHLHYEVRKNGTPVNPISYLSLNN
jgi:murein DD-endopeptidase MepM/ murein hydrolase activator NlpD